MNTTQGRPVTSVDAEVAGGKGAVRARMRAELRAVTETRRMAAGRALAAALIGHPRWPAWRCMLGFAASGREPATAPALTAAHAAGLVIGLPRVAGKLLRYHRVAPAGASAEGVAAALQPGYRGVAEPAPDTPVLDFDGLPPATVVLVPGAAFDRTGGRLGWGGGHYDRALAGIERRCGTALLIGVCFVEQLIDRVPRASHDLPVDLVVTEEAVVDAQRGRQPHE
jgi:5-formyltetrahydrofolate cyclo-ligase